MSVHPAYRELASHTEDERLVEATLGGQHASQLHESGTPATFSIDNTVTTLVYYSRKVVRLAFHETLLQPKSFISGDFHVRQSL
jgi:hypothetical protein